MDKKKFMLTRERLMKMGIDPNEAVKYLENKKAIDLNPVHVRAYQLLRTQPVVSS